MRLTLCEASTGETRPDPNHRNYVPYSFRSVCGFFNIPCRPSNTEDAQDGAYTVFIGLIQEDLNV